MDFSNESLKQLEQIHQDIFQLSVDDELKKVVLGDVELAVKYFLRENILGVFNALTVVVMKLHTYLLTAKESCEKIDPILRGIHWIQQAIIRKPVNLVGPVGATGAQGPSGCPGPVGYTGATGVEGPSGCPGPVGYTGATGPSGAGGTTTFVTTSTIPIVPAWKYEQRPCYTFICRADQHRRIMGSHH